MSWVIFALIVGFVVAQVYVEAVNEAPVGSDGKPVRWWSRPLSYYLSGVKHWQEQQAAYLGLVLAEALMVWRYAHGVAQVVALAVAAVALFVVAASRWPVAPRTTLVERVHVIAAGLAFAGMYAFELVHLWGQPAWWLPAAGVATAACFARFWPGAHTLDEKAATLWALVGLIAIAGVPL